MLNAAAVRDYARGRLWTWPVGAMLVVVVVFSWAAGPSLDPLMLLCRLVAATFALASWRLRDDLFSVYDDAARHPERVLVRHGQHGLFYGLVIAGQLAVGGLMWVMHSWFGALSWWVCVAGVELLYAARLGVSSLRGRGGELLSLGKYGALVMALGSGAVGAISGDAWCVAVTTWASFVVYELLEDERFATWRARRAALALALCSPPALLVAWLGIRAAWGVGLSLALGLWMTLAMMVWRWPVRRFAGLMFLGGLGFCVAVVWPWLW